jgi:hypothetical protein
LEIITKILENKLKVYKSDRFDLQDASYLSLFLYPNSVQIFTKDENENTICIHSYHSLNSDSLEKLILTDPLLRADIPAKIYLHSPYFALVPGVLYQPGQEAVYLEFSGKTLDNPFYFNTALDSNNLQVLSGISGKLFKTLSARFSDLSFHHGSVSFLSYLFKERFNLIGQEILIYVFDGNMYSAAFTDQELTIFNIFEINSLEDILKYLLILVKQLEYNRNLVRISVFNEPDAKGINEEWGKSYFNNFRMIEASANQSYTHGFKNLKHLSLFEVNWQFV